jgi:nucleoid-associated protein YgaU
MPTPTPSPTKLIIYAYSDSAMSKSSQVGQYTVRVNPEKYTQSFAAVYNQSGAAGSSNVPLKFDHQRPSTIKFELVFDATGAIPGSATNLTSEINSFLGVVWRYQGSIHEPFYLKLYWGDLTFGARLTELSLSYTLFRPDGTPLRARGDVTFTNYVDPATLAKQEKKKSADLTHIRQVVAGDTLPALCGKIYGRPELYPLVARHNKLRHFRRLEPGTQIVFPPIAALPAGS